MFNNLPDVDWPIWAVFAYLLIKDALPTLSSLLTKMTGIIVPARVSEKKLALEQEHLAIDHATELEEKRLDLHDREVVALEQIGKSLIMIDARLQSLDKKTDLMTTGLVTANQALAVMLDRAHRRREDYTPKTSPVVLGRDVSEE
jgi:hypothetical protein